MNDFPPIPMTSEETIEFNKWLSEHDKEIKAQVYNETFEIVLEEEHQITTFADKIGIKILKKKNEMLKGK